MLWGEKEREKSGVSDKTVREEGFVEELVFEQRPEVRGELLRWPWSRGHALGKVSRPGRASSFKKNGERSGQ